MSHNMNVIATQLREAGYRVTPQRQLILDAVCELGGHVTPEEVYARVQMITPSLNLTTVYRTLQFLSEQNILTITQLRDGRSSYEIASSEPHHHLVCRGCNTSIEIPHAALRSFFHNMQGQHGFTIDMNHITFFGYCADCYESPDTIGLTRQRNLEMEPRMKMDATNKHG